MTVHRSKKLPRKHGDQYWALVANARCLEYGWDPNQVGPRGLVPLHFAAVHGASGEHNQLACIRLLIDAGANVSAADDSNMSAILYAAIEGCSALVTALLDAGADANSRDRTNWTPLHHAIYSNRGADCVRLLINAGADADARCDDGKSPLSHCILLYRSHFQSGRVAESKKLRRIYPILLRGGATLPASAQRTAGATRARARGRLSRPRLATRHLRTKRASMAMSCHGTFMPWQFHG